MNDKQYRIYVCGDSHTGVFIYAKKKKYPRILNIVTVNPRPGKTAGGLCRRSNMDFFINPLANLKAKIDYLIVQLGEIDCDIYLWVRAKGDYNSLIDNLETATDNIIQLAREAIATGNIKQAIILGPIIPILTTHENLPPSLHKRTQVTESHIDRTNLTLLFCKRLKMKAEASGFLYLDINDKIIDKATGVTHIKVFKGPGGWHHLAKPIGVTLWIPAVEQLILKDNKNATT